MFLYDIIISPIIIIVDWIFNFFLIKFESFGVIGAVFGVSIVINFLALPLYNIADALQEKERKTYHALAGRISRIKKGFKGNEQFMMLSEYYRQNNYHPIYVLRSSLSILIEIPFFIAAYNYLSHCEALKGAGWWIFSNLGSPDKLFSINFGSFVFDVNILPILMTVINFISGAIYTKGFLLKEKLQLYIVSILFLVLLWDSPSGLVIYWILNNLFSLVKNIVLKMKNPLKIVYIFFSFVLSFAAIYLIIKGSAVSKSVLLLLFTALFIASPFIKKYLRNNNFLSKIKSSAEDINFSSFPLLLFSGLSLAFLAGFLLPASIISSSTQAFSFLGNTDSPVSYVMTSLFTFLGLFVFWPCVIYKMFGSKTKSVITVLFFILMICAILNAYIFKSSYGDFNIAFELENSSGCQNISKILKILSLITPLLLLIVTLFICKVKKLKILSFVSFTAFIAIFGLGLVNISTINSEYSKLKEINTTNSNKNNSEENISPVFHLSKNNKNVIVFFLDRAINSYFPKVVEESSEIKDAFNGFVYYPNTVSFSTNTLLAHSAMAGGYEYALEEFNKEPGLIREKFAEASFVMPEIFNNAKWNVTVSDLVKPDSYADELEIYKTEENKNISLIDLKGKYNSRFFEKYNLTAGVNFDDSDKICDRQIKNFTVMEILNPFLRLTFYDNMCNHANSSVFKEFYDNVSSLDLLSELTDFNSEKNNFIFISNDTTHSPIELDENFMLPGIKLNKGNLKYYPETKYDQTHYDVNYCSYLKIASFINYLKKNQVYDNTRIIIVSDHGRDLDNVPAFTNSKDKQKKAFLHPVLLFKDFNSNDELKQSDDFMTNADTLFLSLKNQNMELKNPFTGKDLIQAKENGVNIYSSYKFEYQGDKMINKSQFTLLPENGFHVKNNIFEESNWEEIK